MSEAWVELACPDCADEWQANPSDLPSPGEQLTCDGCGAVRPTAEFLRTQRALEILEQFHA